MHLEKKDRNMIKLIDTVKDFLKRIRVLRSRIIKSEAMKLKMFHVAKYTTIQVGDRQKSKKKIFSAYITDKGLVSRIYNSMYYY